MILEEGSEVELKIVDMAYGGRGVGRLDSGIAVFVPGVLEHERVRVRVTALHKRYAEADRVDVLEPSPFRREVGCPLAARCGGCAYQHVDYAEEVNLKNRQFISLLERIGGLQNINVLPPVPAPKSLGYRNKIVLHAGRDGELGYYGTDKRTVIDVEQCPLAVAPINEQLKALRADPEFMQEFRNRDSLTLRWTAHDGTVYWKGGETTGGPLMETTPIGDLQVPRGGFAQINPEVMCLLVEQVVSLIKQGAPEYLLDLYAGAGLFALAAAKAGVKNVLGVEVNGPAVRSARSNARRLKLESVTFAEGDATVVFAAAMLHVPADKTLLIADPPRDGLSPELCKALNASGPASIIYVSCAPDTLARDLKLLTAGSYQVEHCQLLDMFPRTAHFETITSLHRKQA